MARTVSNCGVRNWTPDRLPDLSGKLYVITGGNSGIGLDAARILAAKNADVVIAGRDRTKVDTAVADITPRGNGAKSGIILDLASLGSIRDAAAEIRQSHDKIDALVNNAGIMQTPQLQTKDGFELQLGTNHLGHFYWTGLLIDLVIKADGRVTTVSSIAHKFGQIHLDDLMLTDNYRPETAYGQSKLANIMFAIELDRRIKKAGASILSTCCHPGYSATNLQFTGPTGLFKFLYAILNPLLAQSSYKGSIPTVLAAAGTEAESGGYYGPRGFLEAGGRVSDATVHSKALDEDIAHRLWEETENLLNFKFPDLS